MTEPRQCTMCLVWALPKVSTERYGQMCKPCSTLARSDSQPLQCRRCLRMMPLDHDGLCRACVIVIHGEYEAGLEVKLPAPIQLRLFIPSTRRQAARALPRARRGASEPLQVLAARSAPMDDPRVLPPTIPGQIALFAVHRRIGVEQVRRITGRRWPEEELLRPIVAQMAVRKGCSPSWRNLLMNRLRLALALRDAEGDALIGEELLEQINYSLVNASREVFERAGMWRPRVAGTVRRPRDVPRACEDCECWGQGGRLCLGCHNWRAYCDRYPVGLCTRCRRDLPLRPDVEMCRGCLAYLRECGAEHADSPFTQLALAGVLAHRLLMRTRALNKLPRPVAVAGDPDADPAEQGPAVSAHLLDPAQPALFDADRDWSRVARLPVSELPTLTPQAQDLLARFTTYTQATRTEAERAAVVKARRVLRTVISWVGADAPISEYDVRAVAVRWQGGGAPRVLRFLSECGFLQIAPMLPLPAPQLAGGRRYIRLGVDDVDGQRDDDRQRHAISVTLAPLSPSIGEQIGQWVLVMRGEGRLRHPCVDYRRIRRYLQLALPVLHAWDAAGLDLRGITCELVLAQLEARSAKAARALHNVLRSIFAALKQQRVVFHNPMTGISLTTPVRLPAPLPTDKLAGLLDRVSGTFARLVVVLVAVHALRLAEVARIQLTHFDASRASLTVRRHQVVRTVYLDELTLRLIGAWLAERGARWPRTANSHLLITTHTAQHPALPGASSGALRACFPAGVTPRQLWTDRVLDEARVSEDPVHLVRLFGLHPHTAVRYVHAAHPDKSAPRIR